MISKKRDFYLFQIFGFRVSADWSWLVVFVLMSLSLATGYFPSNLVGESGVTYWLMGIISSALLFLSVVLHEVGHSYVAYQNGIRILGIRLFIFGGVAEMASEPRSPEVELKVAVAGPLVSAVLAVFFYLLSHSPVAVLGAPFLMVTSFLARVNLAMVLFNLLPGFPLDGGRILRALLWRIKGSYYRSTLIATGAGKAVAFGFMGLGILSFLMGGFLNGLWLIFVGMFLHQAAQAAQTQLELQRFGFLNDWLFQDYPDWDLPIRNHWSFRDPDRRYWEVMFEDVMR
ncbi:MAG: site-2 protease family protein [bacterium]